MYVKFNIHGADGVFDRSYIDWAADMELLNFIEVTCAVAFMPPAQVTFRPLYLLLNCNR